jgi:ubiquinone/menaquinone biosynthesis C-methylase UbiE
MNTIYDNDAQVGVLTREAFARTGSRLLQIHRFAEADAQHVTRLLDIFDPPKGITIADVGCGVGQLAYLMTFMRPDLTFYCINKSEEQLSMVPWVNRLNKMLGTAEALPIKKCDAVMVTYVLGHIVDLQKFIDECLRVGAKQVYIYDLFVRDPFCDSRLTQDLHYTDRTVAGVQTLFEAAGFTLTKQDITTFVPDSIAALMPSPETLNNTVSAALVFER